MTHDPRCELDRLSRDEPRVAQRQQAVRTVAAHARTAADLADLLDMLGLSATEGRTPGPKAHEPEPAVPSGPPSELLAELAAVRQWLAGSG